MIPVSCFLYYNVCLQETFPESAALRGCNTRLRAGRGIWSLLLRRKLHSAQSGRSAYRAHFCRAGLPFLFLRRSASRVCPGYKPLQLPRQL